MKKNWLVLIYVCAIVSALAVARLFPTGLAALAQNPTTPVLANPAPVTPAPAVEPVAPVAPTTASTLASNPVKGDLVIDFMGSLRGMVEPCG